MGSRMRLGRLSIGCPQRGSFTLIEVLLTLTLTALIAGVSGQIALNLATSRRGAARLVRQLTREAYLFDRLGEDFAGVIQGLPGSEGAVMVFGTPRQVLQLNVLTAISKESESLHLVQMPATVRYRLAGESCGVDGCRLIREVMDRTRIDARPVRETISTNVVDFQLEVFSAGRWTSRYPPEGQNGSEAAAVRVSCKWSDSKESSTRTFQVADDR